MSTLMTHAFSLMNIQSVPSFALTPAQYGFIGGGTMARSLIGGLLARGAAPMDIIVSEPNADLRNALQVDFGVQTTEQNDQAAALAAIWLIAVKPQVMKTVCEQLCAIASDRAPLVISIAAGITMSSLQNWLGTQAKVVRAMPNTPALIGEGVSGLCANAALSESDRARAASLLQAVGGTVWIEREELMDAVTATSGSGPAYFFLLIEAMQQAAIAQGLSASAARELVLRTALGAAKMAFASDEDAAVLRQRVTSPGGTTAAAIAAFEAGGFAAQVANAIDQATQHGKTLSAQFG